MSKRKLMTMLLAFALSGCAYQVILPEHYKAAEEYCEPRGGVAGVVSVFQGSITIVCKDSKKISYIEFLDSRYKREKHNEQN